MKKSLMFLAIMVIMLSQFTVVQAKANTVEHNWALRMKTIHDMDVVGRKNPLSLERAEEYAKEMIYWAGYWGLSKPEILPATVEAEGNFVNKGKFEDGKYDNGSSKYGMGLYHMQEDTSKWLWEKYDLNELFGKYEDWKVIDPTEAGTCLAALYWSICLDDNEYNYYMASVQWNKGNTVRANLFNIQLSHATKIVGYMYVYDSLKK